MPKAAEIASNSTGPKLLTIGLLVDPAHQRNDADQSSF
jgi:hypothetical protein